ncbi:MAG: transposase domain-containing protein [Myxococcales bacterium]|nr:transposase domain-containing protein [Myxococcales bacterium]
MVSLLDSCAMQGIDPWAYLADVLSRIQEHPVNRMHELTRCTDAQSHAIRSGWGGW